MFAVPGWSVSADALKTQEDPSRQALFHGAGGNSQDDSSETSKKRKRGHRGGNVTEENLADLWKRHIEGKISEKDTGDGSTKKKEKRRKENALDEKGAPNIAVDSFERINGKDLANDAGSDSIEKKRKRRREKGLHDEAPNLNTDSTNVLSQEVGKSDVKIHQITDQDDSKSKIPSPANDSKAASSLSKVDGANSAVKKDAKAKFEQRKSAAAKKREQKSLLQAAGALPPSRTTLTAEAPLMASNLAEAPTGTVGTEGSAATAPVKPTQTLTASTKKKSSPSKLPPLPPGPTLTPLQQTMRAKLLSARFRHLNQSLYTSPSLQASLLFSQTPSIFESYHAGFRAQVAVWPQNPVDIFIQDVKTRAKIESGRESQKKKWRDERKGKKSISEVSAESAIDEKKVTSDLGPLPRTRFTCTIADIGCGDAALASNLKPLAKPLNLQLLSFDLAQGNGPNASLITVADAANLPLADGSVDVAIFCLALMGTNWIDFVEEAGRVVRWGGEVWVAEIKSRFGRGQKIEKWKKGQDEEQGVIDLEEEEVKDGKEGEKTDVNAFVEVWQKRGFILKGEPHLGNKMFVRMIFSKGLVPVKGKGAPERDTLGTVSSYPRASDMEKDLRKMRGKTKFVDRKDGRDDIDESKVLKPCIYKIR